MLYCLQVQKIIIIKYFNIFYYYSAGIHKLREEDIGPGPAAYSNIDANLTKRSSPAYSLKWRTGLPDIDRSPGPQYYPQYDTGRRPPMYSFGIRHSECAGLPITGLDED